MTIDGTDYRKVDGAYAHLGWQSFNKGPGGSGWTSLSQYLWPFLDALAAAEERVGKAVMLMRQVNIKAITAVEVKQDWKDFLAAETLKEIEAEGKQAAEAWKQDSQQHPIRQCEVQRVVSE